MKGCRTILRMKNYAEYGKGTELIGVFVDLRKRRFFVRVFDRNLNEEVYLNFTNRFDILREEVRKVVE